MANRWKHISLFTFEKLGFDKNFELTVFQRIHNVHKRNDYIQEISDTFKILLNQHKTISLQHQILRNSYKTYL